MYPHHFEQLKEGDDERSQRSQDAKQAFAALFAVDFAAFSQDDIEKFYNKMQTAEKSPEEVLKQLPDWLIDRLPVFTMSKAQSIPPHRPGVDHEIVLEEGQFPAQRMYGLARDEGLVVKSYLEDMLARKEIRPSTSRFASPVLVVKKPGGGLRVCVDYRQLNAVTVKSRNTPPTIKETLANLAGT